MPEEKSSAASFWEEIKRRKVVRVIVAYLIVGWLLIQIADVTSEPLRLPDWSDTLVIWLVALGFPVTVILAWAFDITPNGIEVTDSTVAGSKDRSSDTSIAVLPFINMSGDADNEYFSDGLSEELLNVLARLPSLRVCSRRSSFTIKGKDLDMPTIANQLGVRYVLEGSVRRSGDRVRITAQLIDARDDCHLWSETYDRELQDIFAVQDEISGHIFESLKLTLTDDEQLAIQSTEVDIEALDCYLKGRELYHRTESGHLQRAREQFEEAIRIDPGYALAWAGLTYVLVDTYWYVKNDAPLISEADRTSRKAVELAPHLAESHAARGLALRVAEKFEEAEAEFEKAIAINPALFEPIHFYAQMARSIGQFEKSANLFVRAAQVRPEDYQALAVAANMYDTLGWNEQALDAFQQTIDRAVRAVQLNPKDSRALVLGAGAWRRLGQTDKALEWMDLARKANPNSNGVMYNSACIYANMGETEKALDCIERAVELGSRNKRYFETDSDFDSIRDHPRFQELLKRI